MLLRQFTAFLLKGRLHAILATLVIAFIPLIGSVSILIAAFITLLVGVFEGALLFLVASVPLALQYLTTPADEVTGLYVGILGIAAIGNLLVWVFAVLLRRYQLWSWLLEISLLLGIVFVGAAHILYPDMPGWWQKELTEYLAKSLGAVDASVKQSDLQIGLQEVQMQAIQSFKYYATGFLIVSVLLNALLQVVIARWWQIVMFNPKKWGLRNELIGIRLSHAMSGVFVIVLVFGYLENILASDMLPVVFAVYALAGLSLMHYLIGMMSKIGWVLLAFIYLGLIGFFPYSLMALSILAVFDTWLDIRKRVSLLT